MVQYQTILLFEYWEDEVQFLEAVDQVVHHQRPEGLLAGRLGGKKRLDHVPFFINVHQKPHPRSEHVLYFPSAVKYHNFAAVPVLKHFHLSFLLNSPLPSEYPHCVVRRDGVFNMKHEYRFIVYKSLIPLSLIDTDQPLLVRLHTFIIILWLKKNISFII